MINGKENNKMEYAIDDYCIYGNIYTIADSLKKATDLQKMWMVLQNWLAINIISLVSIIYAELFERVSIISISLLEKFARIWKLQSDFLTAMETPLHPWWSRRRWALIDRSDKHYNSATKVQTRVDTHSRVKRRFDE